MNSLQSMCSCSLPGMTDSRWAEGAGGWLREGLPSSHRRPQGARHGSLWVCGDCHSPVALWAKIAQREVGSFHMSKVCTEPVSDCGL